MFGRTLVLTKIDEQRESLATILAGTEGQIALSDEQLSEIDEQLLICSMDDLKEKFSNLYNLSAQLKEQEEIEIQNNLAKKLEVQSGGQFEVWYHKEKVAADQEKSYTSEQRKKIELFMGVDTFLKHSMNKANGLLFLNMSPEELLEGKNRDKVELYLSTVNHKKDQSKRIQLAILPEVEMAHERKSVRKRFSGTKEKEGNGEQVDIMKITELLAAHEILLYYQYETKEKTSAEAFAKTGQKYYRQESAAYEGSKYSEYICCCYPNLSAPEKNMYIGAAFVAGGMLASGSREGEQTLLPKELYPYTGIVREELEKEKFGCCLVSETGEKGWAATAHMILFSARTLAFGQGGYKEVKDVLKGWKEREK